MSQTSANVETVQQTVLSDTDKAKAVIDVEANAKFWENMGRIATILTLITSLFAIWYYLKQANKG